MPTSSKLNPTRRRFLWLLIWTTLCSAVGTWFWYAYLANPAHFPLRLVRIAGEFRYLQPAQIEQQLSQKLANYGFFSIDLAQLQTTIIALPWVATVSIRRVWPDTLQIHITEQNPQARWGTTHPAHWVNTAGERFHPQQKINLAVPTFYGEATQLPDMMAFYQQIQPSLAPLGLQLEALHLNPLGEWQVDFRQGLTLLLGRRRPLPRWRDFTQFYRQLPDQPRRIDMRYEQGFAVQLAQELH